MNSSDNRSNRRLQLKSWTTSASSARKATNKDELLFKCYYLLEELEKGYIGDCPENDTDQRSKFAWQVELEELYRSLEKMKATVREKILLTERLTLDTDQLNTKRQNVTGSIKYNMQSAGVANENNVFENPASLKEKQEFQRRYVSSSKTRDLALKPADTNDWCPNDFLESKEENKPRRRFDTIEPTNDTSINQNEARKVDELVALVTKLKGKLVKKKEREKIIKEEKEMLYNMIKMMAKMNDVHGRGPQTSTSRDLKGPRCPLQQSCYTDGNGNSDLAERENGPAVRDNSFLQAHASVSQSFVGNCSVTALEFPVLKAVEERSQNVANPGRIAPWILNEAQSPCGNTMVEAPTEDLFEAQRLAKLNQIVVKLEANYEETMARIRQLKRDT